MEIKHEDDKMCICDKCFDAFSNLTSEERAILKDPYSKIDTIKDIAIVLENNLDEIKSISRCNSLFQEIKKMRDFIQNIKETYN